VETLRLTYERRRPDPERLAEGFSQSIGAWNNREWRKVLQATVGVNLFQAEPWLRPELKAWAQVNANLITSLEEAGIREVERWTIQGLRTGQRHEEITKKIEDVFGRELSDKLGPSGMRARAKLIARDQVAKLNADLTERRQTAAGVTEYIWRTSLDERVRGNPTGLYPKAEPSHWDREGKTFQWSKPPSDGHPGQPINCRCTAEPVLSGLVEEALGEAG
jgi:SPP1 gp7 family putative phage head morphogenesis protein